MWRVFPTLCYWNKLLCFVKERRKIKVCFNKQRSVTVAGLAAGVSLHLAAVLHSAVVGDLHRLADVGLPALQHLLFVQFLVHAERHQFGAGQPLPGHNRRVCMCISLKFCQTASPNLLFFNQKSSENPAFLLTAAALPLYALT